MLFRRRMCCSDDEGGAATMTIGEGCVGAFLLEGFCVGGIFLG